VKRRDFITLLGGAAVAWPLAARAQQGERVRRIGVLMSLAADDKQGQARLAAFLQGLQELGWTDGRNVRIDVRWGTGDAGRNRRHAAESRRRAAGRLVRIAYATAVFGVVGFFVIYFGAPFVFLRGPGTVSDSFMRTHAEAAINRTRKLKTK
jgi:hypothetical protein